MVFWGPPHLDTHTQYLCFCYYKWFTRFLCISAWRTWVHGNLWKGEGQSSLRTHRSSTPSGWRHDSLGPAICDLDSCPSGLVKTNNTTGSDLGRRQTARARTQELRPAFGRKQVSVCLGLTSSPFSISASSSFPRCVIEDFKKDTLAWLRDFFFFFTFLDFFLNSPIHNFFLKDYSLKSDM